MYSLEMPALFNTQADADLSFTLGAVLPSVGQTGDYSFMPATSGESSHQQLYS